MAAIGLIDMDSCGDALAFGPGSKWINSTGGSPFVDVAYGTFGGYGFRNVSGIGRSLPGTYSHLIHGSHIKVVGDTQYGGQSFHYREGATTHIQIAFIYGEQCIRIYRGPASTLLHLTPAGSFTQNVWGYVEIEIVVHDSAGVIRIWVYGQSTPLVDLTGIDTRNGGSGIIDNIHVWNSTQWNGDGFGNMYFDDWWLVDGSVVGAVHLGPAVVRARYPTSDGSPSEWDPTPGGNHWSTVDERPFSATDYVSTNVNGERDMFGTTDDGYTFNMMGIRVIGQMRKTDVGAAQARLTIKDGANYGVGLTRNLSDTATIYADTFSERPGGAGDWDAASANAMLMGAEKVT